MKKITFLLLLLLLLPILIFYAQETKEVKLIKDFYFEYYNFMDSFSSFDYKERKFLRKNIYIKYLTKRLIEVLQKRKYDDKYDYDPFLQGQDYGDNLLTTLKVVYIISNKYEINFYDKSVKFYFYLKEEDGKIKIDKIKDKYYTW